MLGLREIFYILNEVIKLKMLLKYIEPFLLYRLFAFGLENAENKIQWLSTFGVQFHVITYKRKTWNISDSFIFFFLFLFISL